MSHHKVVLLLSKVGLELWCNEVVLGVSGEALVNVLEGVIMALRME
jgi:hypothetical protein